MKKENNQATKKVQCLTCGYEWNTKSEKIFVSCPNCLVKVQVKSKGVKQ